MRRRLAWSRAMTRRPQASGARIGDCAVEHGVVRRRSLVWLMARHQLQIGRDVEPFRAGQPGLVIGEGAILAPALLYVNERAERQAGLAKAYLHVLAGGRAGCHHSAPEGPPDLLRMRLGKCSSISVRPISSFGVSSRCSSARISPKTCSARAKKWMGTLMSPFPSGARWIATRPCARQAKPGRCGVACAPGRCRCPASGSRVRQEEELEEPSLDLLWDY